MHERHRSPNASPSRSPLRTSKCPGKRELCTTEWAKWPRNGTVLGWSDPTFVHGSVPKSEPWVAPAQQETSFDARGENLGEAGEEGRNYVLQLRLHHLLLLVILISLGKRGNKRHEEEKSDTEKITKLGGSDPSFSAFSRPKSSWGRSRPHRNFGAAFCAVACTDLRICQTRCLTFCMNTKGEARCLY